MAITFKTGPKKALQEKTAKRKKELDNRTSVKAIAASTDLGLLPELKFERRQIKALTGAKRRVRKTSSEQLQRLMRSLQQLKQCVPVLIDAESHIVHGHAVVEAMRALEQKEVWCAVIDHLDEHERELLQVALNRLGETGEFDVGALSEVLVDLDKHGFDIAVSGFSFPELDILLQSPLDEAAAEDTGAEEEAIEPPLQPVSCSGDLWRLGDHLVLSGDSTKQESYDLVLQDARANCVIADSPWNIPIVGFVSGLGKKKHLNFKVGAGEMTQEEFIAFSDTWTQHCADRLVEGSAFFSFIDWRGVDVILDAGRKAGLKRYNLLVWNKGSGGMGACWRSTHELVPVFVKGETLAVNNVELGKHGRNRTNVLNYPGANQKGSSANEALKHHPTPKPVPLVEDLLLDVTKRGAIVLEPFLGSGTTLLAAEKSGRRARCIELDPAYVDVAIRRWEALTNKKAVHASTGLTFDELAAQRLAQAA